MSREPVAGGDDGEQLIEGVPVAGDMGGQQLGNRCARDSPRNPRPDSNQSVAAHFTLAGRARPSQDAA